MSIKSISQIKNLKGKRVLVRVDFNVPIQNGTVRDAYKITQAALTIEYLAEHGARVILVSHLGRPTKPDKQLSLAPVCRAAERLLGQRIDFIDVSTVPGLVVASRKIDSMADGSIAMLENIRFFKEENAGDQTFAKKLASLADIFVLEGFAVAHRAAPSVSGVARYLPAYAGMLLLNEISVLSSVLQKPKRPLVVILAGAKVETKIPVLKNLLPKADHILVGGGIANTYWWATGKKVGDSIIGKEFKRDVIKYCKNKKVILPVDVVVGDAKGKKAHVQSVDKLAIGDKRYAIYDIGPKTTQLFSTYIKKAQTLIYNGAMGRFEQHPYQYGTYAVTHLFAARSKGKAYGVCGGGETGEIIQKLNLFDDVDLVSTGGGAMLEFLAGKKLPGIEALKK